MSREMYSVEELENRRLLSSSPSLVINYIKRDSAGVHATANATDGIQCFTDVPLHVTALATEDLTAHTDLEDTTDSDNALIKASFQWNFGDPGGTYNLLPGFNAAHIYRNAGDYVLTLSVVNEDGYSKTEIVPVHVASEPFNSPGTGNSGIRFYVAATATGNHSGTDTSNAADASGLITALGNGTITDDSQILFKNGDTFVVSTNPAINFTKSNLLITTWTPGTRKGDIHLF